MEMWRGEEKRSEVFSLSEDDDVLEGVGGGLWRVGFMLLLDGEMVFRIKVPFFFLNFFG